MVPLALPLHSCLFFLADRQACRGCSSSRRRPSQASQELHITTLTRAIAVQVIHIGRHLAAQYPWPWSFLDLKISSIPDTILCNMQDTAFKYSLL